MSPPPNLPGYTLDSRIGRGAFGTVYRARWEGSYPCALKVLEEGALHVPYLGTVLEKLQGLPEHPGLLRVHAFDLAGPLPHLSMALLPERAATFDELSGQVSEEEAWGLLRQLSDTLAWMHGHGIVHAGVTGGNVYVLGDERGIPQVLLADAGQAWLGDGVMERLHDQAPCVPPERWRDPGRVLKDGHAEAWDVYAFGVLAWRLLTGDWPRATQLFETVLASRSEGLSIDPPAFAEWLTREPLPRWPTRGLHEWEKPCRAMVMRCLEIDPAQRPESMMEVALALRKCPALRGPLGGADFRPVLGGQGPASASRGGLLPEARVGEELTRQPEFQALRPQAVPTVKAVPVAAAAAMAVRRSREPVVPMGAAAPLGEDFPQRIFEDSAGGGRVLEGEKAVADPVIASASGSGSSPSSSASGAAAAGVELTGRSPVLPSAANASAKAPASRRWLVEATAALLMVGAAYYAFTLKTAGERSRMELNQAGAAAKEAQQRASDAAAQAVILKKRIEEQRVREMAALRDKSALTVGKMLESTPADSADRAAWQGAAAPVADQLREALAACDEVPALTPSSMEARWQLANLYTALGKPEAAQPLLEQLTRDFDTVVPGDAAQESQWQLLKARTLARRGEMLRDQRKTMEAVPLLREASAAFDPWLSAHPDRKDIARVFARNSLLEGRALIERNQAEAAGEVLSRVSTLLPKPEAEDFQAEDTFVLADSMEGLAEIAEARNKLQAAIGQRTQLLQLLLAYDSRHSKSVPCRTRLTEAYLSLGQNLSAYGAPKDAIHAFQQAVKLLSELTTESPANFSYSLQLARAYGEVAELIQSANPTAPGAKEALEYGAGSVTILRRLKEALPQDRQVRLRLASALVLNGELQATAGDASSSLAVLQESVGLATDLSNETTLDDAQRKECRKLGARAWSVIGGLQEKAGKKPEAVLSLNKALEAWAGIPDGDPSTQRMVAATRERLKKLQPGG